jgi:hypothetical protein
MDRQFKRIVWRPGFTASAGATDLSCSNEDEITSEEDSFRQLPEGGTTQLLFQDDNQSIREFESSRVSVECIASFR